MRDTSKIQNLISRAVSFILMFGIVSFILMIFSTVGAFASINTDVAQNDNLVQFLPSQNTNALPTQKPESTNTLSITNDDIKAGNNSDSMLYMNFNVFRNVYKNDNNETIINSDTEDKVMAPGAQLSQDDATFKIQNLSNYTVQVNPNFYVDNAIPVHFKMIDPDGKYLVGGPTFYGDPIDINNVHQTYNLVPDQTVIYKFPWYWAFEEGEDNRDTNLGNLAIQQQIKIILGVDAFEPIPVPPEPEPTPTPPSPYPGFFPTQTGDLTMLVIISIFVALSIPLFTYIYKRKKRKKGDSY